MAGAGGTTADNERMGEKWFANELTKDELREFIKTIRNGGAGNASIGKVREKTKAAVKSLTGMEVTKIVLEGTSIAHIDNPKHNLSPDDIENSVEVINNPIEVKPLDGKNAQGLKLLEFKGDINGAIFFVTAVHKKYKGWLSLTSAYRPEPLDSRLQRYQILR